MKYIYYRLDRSQIVEEINVPKEYKLKICRPKLNSFHNVFWTVLSFFFKAEPKFLEYQYLYENKVVAYLQVIHRLPFFKFIEKNGVHTGPAFTDPNHRGKGLHPALLHKINEDYPDLSFYNSIAEGNMASVKGVLKCGYVPFAIGHKTIFKCYVVDKYL